MTALQAIISRLRPGENGRPAGQRPQPERRRSERRSDVFLLHGRESRLQFAARALGFGTYELDSGNGDIHLSPELKAMAGLPDDESSLSFEQVAELVHPEDRERFVSKFGASLDPRQKDEFADDFRLLRRDGAVRHVQARGRAVFAGHGGSRELLGATGVVADVTARREAERIRERQAALLDLVPEPVLAWDLRHGIVFWNRACQEVYGYSREEALGKPCHELLKAGFPSSRQAALGALSRDGQWAGEVQYTIRDGRQVTVECHMQRLSEGGEATILEFDRRLGGTSEALARSNVELEHFAYVAAHDLQAPLRSITGFAQMLRRDHVAGLDARADHWLDQLLRSARRMQDLIRDLLAYARYHVGPPALQPTDLEQVFADVVDALDAEIRESGAQVTHDELPTVIANATQVSLVLQNLIGNGIKYRAKAPPRVHVSTRRQAGEWLISVRDNGIGIARDNLERIFEIFHRLHSQQEYPGTGIGLAVCHRFVQQLGGRIWAESEPGRGSVFHFTLPDHHGEAAA